MNSLFLPARSRSRPSCSARLLARAVVTVATPITAVHVHVLVQLLQPQLYAYPVSRQTPDRVGLAQYFHGRTAPVGYIRE